MFTTIAILTTITSLLQLLLEGYFVDRCALNLRGVLVSSKVILICF